MDDRVKDLVAVQSFNLGKIGTSGLIALRVNYQAGKVDQRQVRTMSFSNSRVTPRSNWPELSLRLPKMGQAGA